ncbi:MAG: L-threonylcarbamoyladenylate synthase [Gammaproteobacteria bacterium]|nr:L-threonylcarbamoyladenylate synthase [Gammaproteobacteria bacterium]MCP4090183.1 L-threonylcarbamoyladenylate synthase [Gammaproteobacteria bacterium]MCP4277954.1 L-threonylcarbamoyladenylate synthase [Gammaproteobacteria bacterium]MCP4832549.1 L-threonylcarbamoyladenylate synthase [Gammaproteobacteria bacterium]MCP4928669.1 L-threonylcarbamoyladenylate synthase [Gammaproteobacteria bacterium]
MTSPFSIRKAADILLEGGVVAYPTEGVYGLGCLPGNSDAITRILDIKSRSLSAGFILVSPNYALLEEWLSPSKKELSALQQKTNYPVTWVVTAKPATPDWLTGGRATLAVRISTHPVVTALCDATHTALVSTSANRAGRPSARTALSVRKFLGPKIDYVVSGALGKASGASEIRRAEDNQVLRPA